LLLLQKGRLSATSAMTNRPSWTLGASRLKDFADRADLGVHLNLTCGTSLGVMSRFAPSGGLPTLTRVLRGALLGGLPLAEIADEFRRQIDAFAHGLGREPDFIDGHQHVHAFPRIRAALFAAIDALGLARRLYVRDPADQMGAIAGRRLGAGKAIFIAGLARGFGAELDRRGIARNIGFSGIVPFDPRRDYGGDFERFLSNAGERPLVMCHPGFVDGELGQADPVAATRPLEHAFLASEGFQAVLARHEAKLVRFRELQLG
jgi:predicted glycoside hydrolase/deacetylase ChbG (UPF0249 family)